jgi:serine/threonine protein kinase
MAPEQVKGEKINELVDVYAFGILLFELLTGQKPIAGDTVERIFYKHSARAARPEPPARRGRASARGRSGGRLHRQAARRPAPGLRRDCGGPGTVTEDFDAATRVLSPAESGGGRAPPARPPG